MILVDTSAWVEFLRDTGSVVCILVEELLAADIAVCEPVRMEYWRGHGTKRTFWTCGGCWPGLR